MTWLTVTEHLCHKWPRMCSTGPKHFPVPSSFMTYHRVCNLSSTTVSLMEQELLTIPEHMSLPSVFSEVRVTRSLVLCVMCGRSLFVLLSFFFWSLCCLFFDLRIHDWYLQTLLRIMKRTYLLWLSTIQLIHLQ
jgi:hypothetical protein